MISLLKQILQIDNCKIREADNKILIFEANALYPEDYIEVSCQKESIVVSEVHRADSKVIIDTSVNEKAVIYACVLCMRLFETLSKDDRADELKKNVKNNEIYYANAFLKSIFSSNTYTIGVEDVFKISLIANAEKADVKYRNEYLAKDAGLVRAYGVLYNYSKELEYIRDWYKKNSKDKLKDIEVDEVESLYILGKISNL